MKDKCKHFSLGTTPDTHFNNLMVSKNNLIVYLLKIKSYFCNTVRP